MDSIIIFCAKDLFLIILLLIALQTYKLDKTGRIKIIINLMISALIGYALAKIASSLYYDPRPFVKTGVTPLIAHSADNGFPSDHSWFSAFMAITLLQYNRQLGSVACGVAGVVGASRVLAHVHSPIDVLVGLIIGGVAGYVGYLLMEKLFANKKSKLTK